MLRTFFGVLPKDETPILFSHYFSRLYTPPFLSHRSKSTTRSPIAMSEYRSDPPPESSNQPRGGVRQSLRKMKDGLTKKLPKRFKRTRNHTTAAQDVEIEGVSSSQKIEDTLHFHPSNDNKHPTTSKILSDSGNQGLSGEPASQVQATASGKEEGPNPQLVDAELQAWDYSGDMRLLWHPPSVMPQRISLPRMILRQRISNP
ncbi:hypothetical protein DFJ58DRAFT_843973 [Suillus subalutaceus]|uniref:uncharacterized protein n=1 Tax=Suillus subalutaceus TaxID=48586 RepID=UPI001B867430|nr:uncharacterized protein DFJ58DRAFT_843973 [Suillus subalutaceus]KAG1844647.1 hypothetical protein DFJ58DRAFT_843973 [Suillus subalutaceus]